MAKDSIPYALLTQEIEVPEGDIEGGDDDQWPVRRVKWVKIWVCLNLIDHRVMGLGLGREAAIEAMRAATMAMREGERVPAKRGRAEASISLASTQLARGHTWEVQ